MRTTNARWMVAALCLTSGLAHAQGYPVIDVANLAQTLQTVTSLKQQLTQELALFQSLNGSRGIAHLLDDPTLGALLPAGWQGVYTSVRSGNLTGLSVAMQQSRQSTQVFDCTNRQGLAQSMCTHELTTNSVDEVMASNAYVEASRRLDQTQALLLQIDHATDPKAIADLNARLTAQSALIQSEQTRLSLFKMLADTEERMISQQKHELSLRRASAKRAPSQDITPLVLP